jgi:COX assembly mitochondrial protein 2
MHPPLDRPHPDCQPEIAQLHECHLSWHKFFGACNDIKTALDQCLRREKRRLMKERLKDYDIYLAREQLMMQKTFGRDETFSEYLAHDENYLEALRKKREREQHAAEK